MMATSLADQLRRLALPQTTVLLQDKKRASLLFDPKEAANLDRETVYELGLSGFKDLKCLKASFNQFEQILFNVSSISLERSVLSKEANSKLNKQIEKFLLLLSPYFLVKPAHKALEWLIHRFHIHIYNVSELIMLILPYHETPMFVRVLQLLDLSDPTSRWHWLQTLQKPGIVLPKSLLLKRCSKDVSLLKFICDMTLNAIKRHKTDASCLSTLFAFYCTTLVGALEVTKSVTELQITHLLKSVLKGLSSTVPEFHAASLMITAQLLRRSQLTEAVLNCIVDRVVKNEVASLSSERILLLLVLYQTQHATLQTFPCDALVNLADQPDLLIAMTAFADAGVQIVPLLKPLLFSTLKMLQDSSDSTLEMKLLAEELVVKLSLDKGDAKIIIRCVLEAFNVQTLNDAPLLAWYGTLLNRFERQYATEFDAVVHETLTDSTTLEQQQKALKTILGFTKDFQGNMQVFHQLQHSNDKIRIEALKCVRENYAALKEKDMSTSLLARLNDDSWQVVNTILSFPHTVLVDIFGTETLYEELIKLISRCSQARGPWLKVAAAALSIVCSQNLDEELLLSTNVFLSVFAYLFPINELEASIANKILQSPYGKSNRFLLAVEKRTGMSVDASKICHCVFDVLSDLETLPSSDVIKSVIDQSEKTSATFAYLSSLLLSFSLPKDSTPEQSNIFLATIQTSFGNATVSVPYVDGYEVDTILKCLVVSREDKLPIHGLLHCLQLFIQRTQLPKEIFKSPWWLLTLNAEHAFSFLVTVYNALLKGCSFSVRELEKTAYVKVMKTFVDTYIPDIKSQTLFICNIGVGKNNNILTPELQIRSFLFLQFILKNTKCAMEEYVQLDQETVVPALLIASSSVYRALRVAALNCLRELIKTTQKLTEDSYTNLIHQLMERQEELQLDADQMSLAMYTSLSPDAVEQSLIKKSCQPHMARILDALVRCVVHASTPSHVSAALLSILQHVNSVHVLEMLVPLGNRLLEEGKREGRLDGDKTDVLQKILMKFGHNVSHCMKSTQCWKLLEETLRDHHTLLCSQTSKASCPAILALDVVTRELFDEATADVQQRLLFLVVDVCTDTDRPTVVTSAGKLFKRIWLDAELILPYLMNMRDAKNPNTPRPQTKNIQRFLMAPTVEMLHTDSWRRGITLLEFVQNKKKMQNVDKLLPVLFDIIKKCLQFVEQAPVEYTKQLLLSCLLHCCQKLSPDGSHVPLPAGSLNVGLVVECIRATQNPQTHHHALLVLSHVAGMIPDQVLHNVMAIFTFMGSSVLRQDDAYSFQVIEKIVDSVIPILVRASDALTEDTPELSNAICGVLRVFVDALLDIPEHRRLPLFEKLLGTLNTRRSLWLLLCLVLESHVVRGNVQAGDNKRIEFALHLTQRFTPEIVLASCMSIMQYLIVLPTDKEEKSARKKKQVSNWKAPSGLFDVERHTAKQLRHLKYSMATFLSTLLSSPLVVAQVAALAPDDNTLMEPIYRSMIEHMLTYIQVTSHEVAVSAALTTAKYWRVMLSQGYDILDKVNALLPGDMFLKVVQGLLTHSLLPLRRKALELLNSKLHRHADLFDVRSVIRLFPYLITIISTIETDEEKKTDLSTEVELIQQTALLSVKLLAHHFAAENPTEFKEILSLITDLACGDMPQGNLLASLVLCLAELCACLKVNAILNLARFMPALLAILDKKQHLDSPDMILLSIVTAVDKICEALAQFLSPYLKELLLQVSILSARWKPDQADNAKTLPVVAKLKSVRQKMAFGIPPRVLIPSLGSCYSKLLARKEYSAIGPLLGILSESFSPMSSSELKHLPDLTTFFLNALTLRSELVDSDLQVIAEVEGHVVDALVGLVLKLSETTFRPLYFSLFHWVTEAGAGKDRAITFYRLSSSIAKSLKSLFVLFAGHFLSHAAQLLTSNNLIKTESLHFDLDPRLVSQEKSELLVRYILETLYSVFLYDSVNFVNKERFETLMQPIVDQLEDTTGGHESLHLRAQKSITPCIAQFAAATGDDVLWKQLNYQVLLKTRHNQPQVRLAALETLCAVARKLGDDFLPLLPETIPFLAELLEDEEEVIERAAQKAMQDLEQVLGEPLKKYF